MNSSIRCVSDHAEDLGDGRTIAVGAYATDVNLEDPVNTRLLDERRIIKVPDEVAVEPVQLTGKALRRRARQLDIAGRSGMDADELREAIAQAENRPADGEGDADGNDKEGDR